jgi:hypothetical protein
MKLTLDRRAIKVSWAQTRPVCTHVLTIDFFCKGQVHVALEMGVYDNATMKESPNISLNRCADQLTVLRSLANIQLE